jgi:hypothetical protein
MKLVLVLALGSFLATGCAAQDEIVSTRSADSTTTSAQVPAARASSSGAPIADDDDAVAARRKQQDDADWAQAQQQYEAQKQQIN